MWEIIVNHFYSLFYYNIYSTDFGLNILKKKLRGINIFITKMRAQHHV
jgi:hypothetical protein